MVELGMLIYEGIADLADTAVPINVHPFLIFQGDVWETDENLKKLRNLLNDFFFMN